MACLLRPDIPLPLILIAALAGLCTGSFLNTCIYRLPRGMSLIRPRSHCPACEETISPVDLVPLLGYLLRRGRCRQCDAPIGAAYPLIELATAALAVAALLQEGASPAFFRTLGLAAVFLGIAVVDFRRRIVPDAFVGAGLALALGLSPWGGAPGPAEAALGLVLGGGSFALLRAAYRRVRGREGMGAGDVKLAALMGAALGPWGWLQAAMIASLAGAAVGAVLIWKGRATWQSALPFGTFLSGAAIALLYCAACLRL